MQELQTSLAGTMGLSMFLSCASPSVAGERMGVADFTNANVSAHLAIKGRVNLGSYYTPAKYVELVAQWLVKHNINSQWTIADLSCGYGAFFELAEVEQLKDCVYVGNDIDAVAIAKAKEFFPFVCFRQTNALSSVSRKLFGIEDGARIVVVGNPPYNDVTSQINQSIKQNDLPIDRDIFTRDLGMSSLLAYNKIAADYVAVLHPLSYLVKKANFQAARKFFSNYQLLEHRVFSSQEFAGTSKLTGFPVVIALYRREVGNGLTFDTVRKIEFETVEGERFSLSGFEYITNNLQKYPHKNRYNPEILFYTMRDINALKRSRTFIRERTANAVDVNPAELPYYCYIDCFKRYAEVPYYLGNFDVPFLPEEFEAIKDAAVKDVQFNHPEIFGTNPAPTEREISSIKNHIKTAIKGRNQ